MDNIPLIPKVAIGLGQDSHRFLSEDSTKPCIVGGVIFEEAPGFQANSDGDVLFHALCNAITSITGLVILGGLADDLCKKDGITDSRVYLEHAVASINHMRLQHVSFSLEGQRPHFLEKIPSMKKNVAEILKIEISQVGITATTGEALTAFGCGEGVQCLCILTALHI